MLKIIEVSTAEELSTKYVSGDAANDYMYFLKYANTIMFTDNGIDKYFNSVQECLAADYAALTTKQNTFYLVKQADDSYKCYFKNIVVADTNLMHSHVNKNILDKFSLSDTGVLLYDNNAVDDITNNHTHDNKTVIDKLTQSLDGKLLFNGSLIEGTGGTGGDTTALQQQIDSLNQRSTIGAELDYCFLTNSTVQTTEIGDYVKFDTIKANQKMTIDTVNYLVTLKAGRSYKISCGFMGDSNVYTTYGLINKTTGEIIRTAYNMAVGFNGAYSTQPHMEYIYKPIIDCQIGVFIKENVGAFSIRSLSGYFIVEQTGHSVIVDPMSSKDKYTVEYGGFSLLSNVNNAASGNVVKFNNKVGNIPIDVNTGFISLKAGKNYFIAYSASGAVNNTAMGCYYGIYNNTTSEFIGNILWINSSNPTGSVVNSYPASSLFYTPTVDCTICFKNSNTIPETNPYYLSIIYAKHTSLTIQEVSQPIITEYTKEISNPLTTSDISQETPVGSVIAYMGLTAPTHYLVMDGKVYNIADYIKLADFIKNIFGSYNYFGGDGVTTFAVPDARGEFIRGYDPTAIRDPEGATRGLGKHQNATRIANVYSSYAWTATACKSGDIQTASNIDSYNQLSDGMVYSAGTKTTSGYITPQMISPRPTNINVLYCIKYEPTYYAVNQYGGFDSTVLFDGAASANGNFTLQDTINNYNYLVIMHNSGQIKFDTLVLSMNKSLSVGFCLGNSTTWYTYAVLTFNDKTMTISGYTKAGYSVFNIAKIVGFKGQLPTLISGGVF